MSAESACNFSVCNRISVHCNLPSLMVTLMKSLICWPASPRIFESINFLKLPLNKLTRVVLMCLKAYVGRSKRVKTSRLMSHICASQWSLLKPLAFVRDDTCVVITLWPQNCVCLIILVLGTLRYT